MFALPVVMRVSFAHQPSFSRSSLSDLYSARSVHSFTAGKRRIFYTVVCSIPARDVVIDFGKYKGCRMGTLPSRYLQWLVRESHQATLAVWGDYAKEVLQDPYYKDRLEWQSIERLSSRGEMRKGGLLSSSADAKGSMKSLGWDLSDHSAWSKVNFSLLGTTVGGRIPRKEPDHPLSSTFKSSIAKPKTGLPKLAMKAKTSASSGVRLSLSRNDGSATKTNMNASVDDRPQPTKSLTLQEELHRRRQLRRERSAAKSLTTQPPVAENAENLLPGRDSLLKRIGKREDND